MPPLIKKRGRPKGHGLTTIGFPAKRARKEVVCSKRPCSFTKLHVSEKEKGVYYFYNIHHSMMLLCMLVFT